MDWAIPLFQISERMILGIIAGPAANPLLEQQNPGFGTHQQPLHPTWSFDSKQPKTIRQDTTDQITELQP